MEASVSCIVVTMRSVYAVDAQILYVEHTSVCVRACVILPSLQFPYALFAWLLPGDCKSYDTTVL